MLDEFVKCNLEFEDAELSVLVNALNYSFDTRQDNFVLICKDVYRIWKYCKNNYWKAKDDKFYNAYDLLSKFGFDKKAVSRYKTCYEKFIIDNSQTTSLYIPLQKFSPSKLFEMLSLSQSTVFEHVNSKRIRPEMTVKEIRSYIKMLKNGCIEDKSEEIKEDEIPMAYDPKQKYDFKYFESMTKNQLLNMIWSLQEEYQKLKHNKEKKQK